MRPLRYLPPFLLFAILCALPHSLPAADAANDLILSQRKADNSGTVQRNVAPDANSLLAFDGSKLPTKLSISGALDLLGSAARGDVIYRGASGWSLLPAGTSGQYLKTLGAGADPVWATVSGGGGGGDALTSNPLSQFAATTSAQLAGVISDETGSGALVFGTSPSLTTPSLGVATATSLNGITFSGSATPALTVTGSTSVSGSNTGDQTITLSGDVSGSGTGAITATLATVNANVGSFGSATAVPTLTLNGKGLITAASATTIAIPASAISDSTAAGRTLLTAADAAAQKTALSLAKSDVGLGSVENTALSTWGGSTNIVTLGNVTTGTWSGTTVAVNKGGTGQTSYTNGQILIGNTTSGGLDKATLTAGTGISITNTAGSITINSTASGGGIPTIYSTSYGKGSHHKWIDTSDSTTIPKLKGIGSLNSQGTAATVTAASGYNTHVKWSATTSLHGFIPNNYTDYHSSWSWTASWVVSLGDSIANTRVFAAISSGSIYGSDTATPAVGFRYSTNSSDTNWMIYSYDSNGSTTATSSGVAVALNTIYVLTIVKSGTGITYYIDGSQVGTATWNPSAAAVGMSYIGNVLSGGATHSLHLYDYQFLTGIQ